MLRTVEIRYMMILMIVFAFKSSATIGQTLYVDAQKGNNNAEGTVNDPLLSLDEAVLKTNSFKGDEPVTIKLNPGLYTVTHKLILKTAGSAANKEPYTIEAVTLPDDKAWQPTNMPVILSTSGNNADYKFDHCEGMSVEVSPFLGPL